jgi:ATP-dependent Lon protease
MNEQEPMKSSQDVNRADAVHTDPAAQDVTNPDPALRDDNPAPPDAKPEQLPVLPLKSTVLFPHQMLPLVVGRAGSVAAVDAALATEDKTLVIVSQRNEDVEEPGFEDLFQIGARAVIKKMARAEDVIQIVVQGIERVRLVRQIDTQPYLLAEVQPIARPEDWDTNSEAMHREILESAGRILQHVNPQAQAALTQMIQQVEAPLHQVYVLSSLLSLKLEDEQRLIAARTQSEALELMHGFLTHELQVLEVRKQISEQAQSEMSREQREYLLRKQMRAIQDELGEQNPEQADVQELSRQLEQADLPQDVRKEVDRELKRLERLPAASPDYQVTRSYLELVAELPWQKLTPDNIELDRARKILDRDHFGLEKVKDRIIEHLAVMKLNASARSPILCFVGPPGVGKTSLGKSIAEAIGREFARESLGGLSDEAELRGHRRTYIGAMPGRIIQAMQRAGTRNPLLMLDEIDKLGRDFRGDPGAALLEILDPAQNYQFRDNYLNLPFDLSKVFFIATANTLDSIPRPLLDRIEVLEVSGYSDAEKAQIARRYLLPRQLEDAGLDPEKVAITDAALMKLIHGYTRESGVRNLERTVGAVCRKIATQFAGGKTDSVTVEAEDLRKMLGHERFRWQDVRKTLNPGVAAGLAWTPVGGDVLYIEAVLLPEGKNLTLTGQLGDVMKESAHTAQSFVRSQWAELNLEKQALESGVHLHVPAGATPKDGPSAGVAMAAALASLYSHQPVRADTAMTGEITLSGLVLPVGGIKEKVLAAHRAGMKQVILPKANEPDLDELPDNVREDLEFVLAENVEQVVTAAIPSLANHFLQT